MPEDAEKTKTKTKTVSKKGKVTGGKAKGGSKVEPETPEQREERERLAREQREEAEEQGPPEGAVGDDDDDDEDQPLEDLPVEDDDDNQECWSRERMEAEEKIATFFEEHSYFYDKKQEGFKNKKMQRAKLLQLSEELGEDYTRKCF